MDDKIVWMASLCCVKTEGFNTTIYHCPFSRDSASAAEMKGLAYDFLEEKYPRSQGYKDHHVEICPVFKVDSDRLTKEGKAVK